MSSGSTWLLSGQASTEGMGGGALKLQASGLLVRILGQVEDVGPNHLLIKKEDCSLSLLLPGQAALIGNLLG